MASDPAKIGVPVKIVPEGPALKYAVIGDGLPVEAFGIDKRLAVGKNGVTRMEAAREGVHVWKGERHLLLPYVKLNYIEFE